MTDHDARTLREIDDSIAVMSLYVSAVQSVRSELHTLRSLIIKADAVSPELETALRDISSRAGKTLDGLK